MTTTVRCLLSLALVTTACIDLAPPEDPADPGEVTQALTTTSFTATYTGQGNGATTCNTTFNIS